jgi:aspartate/methionine/tyrosine aminotransferase
MNLSSRLQLFNEPETLKMAKLGRELRSQGVDVIDLSLGEPDFDTPACVKEAAIRALEAGKHVFCEKPLALTQAEAEASVAICAEHGVQLGIGHELRFELGMAEVERMVRAGELGTIMHAE